MTRMIVVVYFISATLAISWSVDTACWQDQCPTSFTLCGSDCHRVVKCSSAVGANPDDCLKEFTATTTTEKTRALECGKQQQCIKDGSALMQVAVGATGHLQRMGSDEPVHAADAALSEHVNTPSLTGDKGLVAYKFLPAVTLIASFGIVWYIHRHRSQQQSETPRTFQSVTAAIVCVELYCIAGPGCILANKQLIVDTGFNFPFAVSSIGIVFSFLLSALLVGTGLWPLEKERSKWNSIKDVMPLGVLHAAANGLSNTAFFYLPVSLIQMVKPTAMTLTCIMVVAMGLDRPTKGTYVAVAVITLGSFLVVYSEHMDQSFTSVVSGALFIGLSLQFGALFSESLKATLTQFLYQRQKMPFIDFMLYSMGVTVVIQCILCYCYEWEAIRKLPASTFDTKFLTLYGFSGLCGLALNFTAFWLMQQIGAVPFKVLTEARNLLIVYAGVLLRGEHLFLWQTLSFCIILIGAAMYTNEKIYELDKETAQESQPLLADVERNNVRKPADVENNNATGGSREEQCEHATTNDALQTPEVN